MMVPSSFADSLAHKNVPWREAERVMDKSGKLSKSDPEVQEFLVASCLEILSEPSVMSDIDKRLRTGSGITKSGHGCLSGCRHSCDHTDFLTNLIREVTSSESLAGMTQEICSKAASTYTKVLARGRADGQRSIDVSTAGYIRRQILRETIVRECVFAVQGKHAKQQADQSKEGIFFALAKVLEEKFLDDPEALRSALDQISSTCMAELMREGMSVVSGFPVSHESLMRELTRMDALAMFQPATRDSKGRSDQVCWVQQDDRRLTQFPELANLLKHMSYLPYELNAKNKDLLLQVNHHYMISKLESVSAIDLHKDFHDNGRKISAIVPIVADQCTVLRTREGREVSVNAKNIPVILLDAQRCEYECPQSAKRRFHVVSYMTGPVGNST